MCLLNSRHHKEMETFWWWLGHEKFCLERCIPAAAIKSSAFWLGHEKFFLERCIPAAAILSSAFSMNGYLH